MYNLYITNINYKLYFSSTGQQAPDILLDASDASALQNLSALKLNKDPIISQSVRVKRCRLFNEYILARE